MEKNRFNTSESIPEKDRVYLYKEKNNDYFLFMFPKELINSFKVSFAFLKTYCGKEKLMIS